MGIHTISEMEDKIIEMNRAVSDLKMIWLALHNEDYQVEQDDLKNALFNSWVKFDDIRKELEKLVEQ